MNGNNVIVTIASKLNTNLNINIFSKTDKIISPTKHNIPIGNNVNPINKHIAARDFS